MNKPKVDLGYSQKVIDKCAMGVESAVCIDCIATEEECEDYQSESLTMLTNEAIKAGKKPQPPHIIEYNECDKLILTIDEELDYLTRLKESIESRLYNSIRWNVDRLNAKKNRQEDLMIYELTLLDKREAEINCDIAMIPYEVNNHV